MSSKLDRQQGFTLVEILIAIGLIAGLVLVLAQLMANFFSSSKKFENSSIFEKTLIAQVLDLRMASFDAVNKLVKRGVVNDYKCDNTNRPIESSVPEGLLYTWRNVTTGFQYCVDIDSYEIENDGNIIDVKFRSVVRSVGSSEIIPINTKYIVMRRGR